MTAAASEEPLIEQSARVRELLAGRSVVLIGMMGAGKSSVGRRMAKTLSMPFVDADTEIEKAAGMSISDIFGKHGEPEFRAGERRVMLRLLDAGSAVIATGGGAWMDDATRAKARERSVSVWLKADAEVLFRRVRKRGGRPLLRTDKPEDVLRNLLAVREPVYAEADVTIQSQDIQHEAMVAQTLDQLHAFLAGSAVSND